MCTWENETTSQAEYIIKAKQSIITILLFSFFGGGCCFLFFCGHSYGFTWVVIHMQIWFSVACSKRECVSERLTCLQMRKYVFEPWAITDITSSSQWLWLTVVCDFVQMQPWISAGKACVKYEFYFTIKSLMQALESLTRHFYAGLNAKCKILLLH